MEIIKPGKIRKIKLKCDEGALIAYTPHTGKLYEQE